LAIIFPFFGPINSAVGALLVSFTVYIIPSLAHMLTYRKATARKVNHSMFSRFLASFRVCLVQRMFFICLLNEHFVFSYLWKIYV